MRSCGSMKIAYGVKRKWKTGKQRIDESVELIQLCIRLIVVDITYKIKEIITKN